MSVHSIQRKKRRDPSKIRYKTLGSHDEFLARISQTLYYGRLPQTDRFSLPVSEIAAELFSEVKSGKSLDRLRLEEAAEISRNACISPCSLVLAMLYLERLKISNPQYVNKASCSDLFVASSLIASKFLNDEGSEDDVLNSEWAVSADVELQDLNKLEKEFLKAINWEVFVKEIAFWQQLEVLEKKIAFKEGKKRGWFSYSDLDKLLGAVNSAALAQTVLSVSAVCLAAYTAGLLTIVGSTMVASNIQRAIQGSVLPVPSLSCTKNQTIVNPAERPDACLTTIPVPSSCPYNTDENATYRNEKIGTSFTEYSETLLSYISNHSDRDYSTKSKIFNSIGLSKVSDYIYSTVTRPFLPYINIVSY